MRHLIRYLTHVDRREKLPRLANTLTNQYSAADIDDKEIELVLMMGVAKDPEGARQVLNRYGVSTAAELLPLLPEPRANWRERLHRWFIWICGAYEHDPHNVDLETYKTAKHKQPLPQGERRS